MTMTQTSECNDNLLLLLLEYGNKLRMETTGLFLIWHQINEFSLISVFVSVLSCNLIPFPFNLKSIFLCYFIWQEIIFNVIYTVPKPI